jgi:hypothetical protein
MKSKLLVMMLLAGSSLFGENHFSIGIGIGVPGYWSPPPPPVVYYAPPPCPDPTYTWIEGYWYPVGPRYHWHAGYWARPPYAGAYWVSPHYYEHRITPVTGGIAGGSARNMNTGSTMGGIRMTMTSSDTGR